MTLKEIAALAGVSVSTASRVLNNTGANCASEAVRQRVWAAANQLGYRPNLAARQLRLGEGGGQPPLQITVVAARFDTPKADPFFAQLYRSLEEQLFARGGTIAQVLNVSALLRETPLATNGYILLGRCPREALEKLARLSENLVGVGRNPTAFDLDEIVCSGQQAATLAMGHLLDLGHRHIAYIGSCSYEERFIGYYEALLQHGFPLDQGLVRDTDQTQAAGYRAMEELLARGGFTAVLCANDATALGALEALNRAGRRDLAVIGIDNIAAAETVTPALTTVHIPKEEMGRAAVNVLLDRIQGGHREHLRVEFPCRLVVRASCFSQP